MSPFMISHCPDFGIRRPYEYEILNSHDFRHEFGGKPMLSRSMYEAYRRSHDGHMNTTRLYPKYPRILTSSSPATLQAVIQDYATLHNNNAVEALIGYN